MSVPTFADLEILVVDDEEFSRSIVVRILRKLGVARIRQAPSGDAGLSALRCLGRVDCVILDFHMPGLNGLQMLKTIRAGSAHIDRTLPVAMLTGHSDLRLVHTAMALDVNAFLSKPTSFDVIKSRIERILTTEREIKKAEVYAGIEVPTQITLSTDTKRAEAPIQLIPIRKGDKAYGVCVPLEEVPADAILARDIDGPDGYVLVPAGTKMTRRLLDHLQDLLHLDACVAQMWIVPAHAY